MQILIQFEQKPLLFSNPRETIICTKPCELAAAFDRIERFLADGFFVAGFLSYEAGYCFEEKLFGKAEYDFPLLCMGCYEPPRSAREFLIKEKQAFAVTDLHPCIGYPLYADDIRQIREHIRAGDVYQITYCLKKKFAFTGDPFSLYRALLKRQPVPYPAYLETDTFSILSLSPEMFMKKTAGFIETKPMKGTWVRQGGAFPDLLAGLRLKFDEKNRAENVMIADLLRNDLGRIGSRVRAPRLFEVARYATLFQMTSTVTARVDAPIPVIELFRSLFPSGSVTGAPKIRAMQIIRGLENEERKIYTGAIGYIAPTRDLFFNIPIRTLLIEGDQGEMGIGGGIVWDSTPQGEWAEGELKARFLADISS